MRIDVLIDPPDGGSSAAVHDAETAALLEAFDPDEPFIVVEGHSPSGWRWQVLDVPLSPTSTSAHRVRRVRFDLLLTPAESLAAAHALDVPFPDGGLYAWQTPTEPPLGLSLLDKDHPARVAAIRSIGVSLLIDQPHAGETAVLWSPTSQQLTKALGRLRG